MILKNHHIIITGASRGIGQCIARHAALAGADLALISRHKAQLHVTLLELEKIKPTFSRIIVSELDVSDKAAVDKGFDHIQAELGRIDGLVNNAGIQPPIGVFPETNLEEWKQTIAVNLFGTVHCCQAVLSGMMAGRYGKIINFSGGGSTSPRPNFSAYGTAKTAIVRFSETLAEEMRDYHIDINSISPGAINTSMLSEILAAGETAGNDYREARQREIAGGDDPNLAARLCIFLLCHQSDGITGKLISARWDNWQDPEFQHQLREDKNLATLRRIDQRNFCTVAKP